MVGSGPILFVLEIWPGRKRSVHGNTGRKAGRQMLDQCSHGGRQPSPGREDQMYDSPQSSPLGQDTDQSARLQRFGADMVGQDRYAETGDGGVADG